jgi:hypothetical protein
MAQRKDPTTKPGVSWLESLLGAAVAAAIILFVATIAGFLLWAFLR